VSVSEAISPPAWTAYALCAQIGGDLWFPEHGEDQRPAKRICAACPVRWLCLDTAIQRQEQNGIFGGMNVRERRAYARGAREETAA
jgi:WhiB family redox-sensing transcriptional regulator